MKAVELLGVIALIAVSLNHVIEVLTSAVQKAIKTSSGTETTSLVKRSKR